jgi:peptidase E
MKKLFFYVVLIFLLSFSFSVSAHQPRLVYTQVGDIKVESPDVSQAFYDELKGEPRNYLIDLVSDQELYINLLVPAEANGKGRYSAKVFAISGVDKLDEIALIDGASFDWQPFYEEFGRDWYVKGPELTRQVPAGKYKVEVYSSDNLGKYAVAIGKKESYGIKDLLNIYWQLPLLKLTFFKTSVLEFFLTPFGIGGIGVIGALLILWALIYFIVGVIKKSIKNNQAKTLLLASSFPQMADEILKLLQKPAYDVTVAFITTASKPQENLDYMQNDLYIMRDELRFNVEEIDIEGKTEMQVMSLLELKDIIFVEGGNAFYLLNAMHACNFEKVIRKLLKQGIVYIGVSAGSMVAGKSVETSLWKNPEKNTFGVKNLRGLNLVPCDIFVHYQPEHAEVINKQMPNPKKRARNLRILTDGQALLVQGNEIDLIGDGEAIVV